MNHADTDMLHPVIFEEEPSIGLDNKSRKDIDWFYKRKKEGLTATGKLNSRSLIITGSWFIRSVAKRSGVVSLDYSCGKFDSCLLHYLFFPLSQIPVEKKSFSQYQPSEILPASWRLAPQM